ncbi:hypothetical protein DXG01_010446, partial [Tephrocybe rancida]
LIRLHQKCPKRRRKLPNLSLARKLLKLLKSLKMHFPMKTMPSCPIGAEMLLHLLPSCKPLAPRPHPFLTLRLHPLTLRKPLLLTLRLHLLPPCKASLFAQGLHPTLLHKVFLPAVGPPPC